MSLDTTSHPGRPGTDELVPSRYALQVGEIDVLVISDGVFPLPAATLATNADPADLAAWLDEGLQPPATARLLSVYSTSVYLHSQTARAPDAAPGRALK